MLVPSCNALTIQVGSASSKKRGDRGTFFSLGVLGLMVGSLPNLPSLVELRAPVTVWA